MSLAYRTGTIAIANGGSTITGTLTAWINQAKQGDIVLLPDFKIYEIAATPTTNTSLTIVGTYQGATVGSGGAYALFKYSPEWNSIAALSERVANFLSTASEILSGSGAPDNAVGGDNSAYFRQDLPYLYFKSGGVWGSPINLQGTAGPAGPTYRTTSASSLAIGSGAKTLTAVTPSQGLAYGVGTRVRVAATASPTTQYMEGVVTAFNTSTGVLTFTADISKGTGTVAAWSLSLAGDPGTQGPAGDGFYSASATSLAIGVGSKTFTVAASLAYTAGQRARAAATSDLNMFMDGLVTGYTGTTLTVLVDTIGGSGTFASWSINLSGARGPQGIPGVGTPGDLGPAGPGYSATSTTSKTIATGTGKTFTVAAGLAYSIGALVRIASAANPSANYMDGFVSGYSGGTLTVDVDFVSGSGTFSDWTINLRGPKGDTGTILSPQGTYSSVPTYSYGNVVLDQNSSWWYINSTPSAGNPPPTLPTINNTYWQLLARGGIDGVGSGTVTSVNGAAPVAGGAVTVTAEQVAVTPASFTPSKYTPAGASITDHLQALHNNISGEGNFANTTLASAATVDIGGASTQAITITGSTTITSFGTVADKFRVVTFAGALVLTHNPTTLILPTAANITTAAGDVGLFDSSAAGWRCVAYTRADGNAVNTRGPTVQVFTASGTWTKPAGCKRVRVRAVGGGGGGGGATAAASAACCGSGGAAGSYGEGVYDVTATATVTVTIGAGGAAGAAANGAGGTGGSTTFGALLTCPGGLGGQVMTSGTTATWVRGGAPGTASSGGTTAMQGASGIKAIRLSGTVPIAGEGGASVFGPGGYNNNSQGAVGINGSLGGGGSGASSNSATGFAGGAGGSGLIIVEEFY